MCGGSAVSIERNSCPGIVSFSATSPEAWGLAAGCPQPPTATVLPVLFPHWPVYLEKGVHVLCVRAIIYDLWVCVWMCVCELCSWGSGVPGATGCNKVAALGSLIKTHSHFPQHWVCKPHNSILNLLLLNCAHFNPLSVFVEKLSTQLLEVWEKKAQRSYKAASN